MKTNFISKSVIASVLFLSPHLSHAAGQILTGETVFSNLTFNILLGAIIFLLFVIIGITRALKGVSKSELFNKSVNALYSCFFLASKCRPETEQMTSGLLPDSICGSFSS